MVDLAFELVAAVLSAVGRVMAWIFSGRGWAAAEAASIAIDGSDRQPDDRSDETHGHPDQPDP